MYDEINIFLHHIKIIKYIKFTYFQCNLGYVRARMGVDGCIWARWDAITLAHKKKDKTRHHEQENGPSGYDFDPFMDMCPK